MSQLNETNQQILREGLLHHTLFLERGALEYQSAMEALNTPHVRMRPKVYRDGDQWCALYGDNIQTGVVGFGKSPEAACVAFDAVWIGH